LCSWLLASHVPSRPAGDRSIKLKVRTRRMVASSSDLATLFDAFDRDSDGRISPSELRQCMEATRSGGSDRSSTASTSAAP
jgi:Ca2+-binding EF-hand superfamily protein